MHESFACEITFKDMQMVQKLEEEIKDGEKKQIRSSEPTQTIQNYGRGMGSLPHFTLVDIIAIRLR